MQWAGRMTRASAAMLLLLGLTACQTTGTGGTEIACRSFRAIDWSRRDTVETQKQVRGHNATGKAVCGWRGR